VAGTSCRDRRTAGSQPSAPVELCDRSGDVSLANHGHDASVVDFRSVDAAAEFRPSSRRPGETTFPGAALLGLAKFVDVDDLARSIVASCCPAIARDEWLGGAVLCCGRSRVERNFLYNPFGVG